MHKLKKLKVKHQKTKRRIQFAIHASLALDETRIAQTIIPELDRHQYDRFFDDEDSSEGTTTSELS